jgi:hypothetical protein
MPLSAEQIAFLTDVLKLDPKLISGTGMYVPIDKAGAALKMLGGGEAPPLDDANGANGEGLSFQRTGPMVSIPVNEDGSPARALEINAGAKDTDLGLPPDPVTGKFVDPDLIDLTRTDYSARPGASQLDANAPIPPEMQGQFDTVFSNNPHGYQPDLGNVADALKPGGRMIMQGRAPANRDFQKVMDKVSPEDGPPNPPDGMRVVEASRNLESADIMGSNFNKTSGEPTFKGPNARLILEKTAGTTWAPDQQPGTTPRPPSATLGETTVPGTLADSGASSSEAAAEGAGLAGAAEAGVLGGAIAGGMALYDDVARVRSGQMTVGDAAVDVGSKTGEVGGLSMAGKLLADAAGAGGGEAAAAGGGDALAGAAGDVTGAGLGGAAGAGGIIGGVVAGGMALIDDVGKVEDGTMTGGHAAVDVTAKTAVGVGAGVAGAVAGAEIGAAVGSIIPGAGTAVGLVAGAVVGGAVGYVGNALTNTETGKAILDAAGDAVDTAIDDVKVAGQAIGNAASTAGSAIGDVASVAGGAVSDAASAAADATSSAADAVGDAASSAATAVSDAAGSAVDAIKSLF